MKDWSSSPPDSEGFWWLFGDEEFGTMGGNYTGSVPPDIELQMVEVKQFGKSLVGISKGRMIQLIPFNKGERKAGYVGVWQKVKLPKLPKEKSFSIDT